MRLIIGLARNPLTIWATVPIWLVAAGLMSAVGLKGLSASLASFALYAFMLGCLSAGLWVADRTPSLWGRKNEEDD